MPESHVYEINRDGAAWVLSFGDLTLRASDVNKKRNGGTSALLTVDRDLSNLYTDTITLTDLAARKRVVKALHPHGVPVDEPMLRALDAAIRQNGDAAGPDAGVGKRKAQMLDDAPVLLDRPLCIRDGSAFATSYVYLDDGSAAPVMLIVREDGTAFSEANLDDVLPLDDVGFTIKLPEVMERRHCWSGKGINAYRSGRRADPAVVFHTLTAFVDRFVRFVRSLGDQAHMCELIACYILSTYLLDAFNIVGYLWAGGEKGSGKSQLLKTVCQVGFAGQELTAGISLAVLRDLSDVGGLIGLDDAEQITDPKSFDADKAALLLAGNRRGVTIPVKEPKPTGKGWDRRPVSIFSPRVFSAIGAPPSALATRCIHVPMCKAIANLPDPMDESAWPVPRRQIVDDLWNVALTHLRAVQSCEREIKQHTALIGRDLDPWLGTLTVAYWLDRKHGVTGLFERITHLSQNYQRERQELEAGDYTRLAVRCLGSMLHAHAGVDPLIFNTSELADQMNKVGKELDQVEEGREIKTARVGRLLGNLRLPKPPARPGKRRWQVSREFYDSLALSHGVSVAADAIPSADAQDAQEV